MLTLESPDHVRVCPTVERAFNHFRQSAHILPVASAPDPGGTLPGCLVFLSISPKIHEIFTHLVHQLW